MDRGGWQAIVHVKVKVLVAPWDPMDCSLCSWNSPGKNTGVGGHSLLQGIFSTQGSDPSLLHCRQILFYLTHQGSPNKVDGILQARILEYVSILFSRRSFQPRARPQGSHIAGRFFTIWAPSGSQNSQTALNTCPPARCKVHNLSQLHVTSVTFLF